MTHTLMRCISLAFLCAGLAACAPAADKSDDGAGGVKGNFEFFTWWTAGGEAEGLDALLRVFKAANPDVVVINATVAGGAGSQARAQLAQRMAAGQPPDSFQVHAGHELIDTYVTTDKMEPLTSLFQSEGWNAVMPQALLDILSFNNEVYSVPVNIHRANVLWYNKAVFSTHSLQPPTTWQEFFAVGDTLRAAQVTPLALGESWTQLHLFETVLLSTLGPVAYRGLWNGTTAWSGAQVTQALTTFDRVLATPRRTLPPHPLPGTWVHSG